MSETSGLIDKPISASGSLSFVDVQHLGRFAIGTAGVVAKLAAPDAYLTTNRFKCAVANDATGWSFLISPDGFANRDCIPIPPGKEVHLEAGYESDQTTKIWKAKADWMPDSWRTYTPTKVWTTNDATGITELFAYKASKGLLSLDFQIAATDGADSAGLTFTPPFVLPDINAMVPFECWIQIGTATPVKKIGYVNMDDGTAENRLITIVTGTLTDESAAKIWGTIQCPYDESWSTYTPTIAYTGGTPANITTKYIYKEIDGLMHVLISNASTDPDNATSLATYTLPFPSIAQYAVAKWPAIGICNVNGTYTDGMPYVVTNNAAAASRLLNWDAFVLYVDGQVGAHYAWVVYPIPGEEVDYDLEDACTWPSAALTPGTPTYKSNYKVIDNDRVYWAGSITSADGNACSSLTIVPPCPPRKRVLRRRVAAWALVNATWTACGGYLNCDQDDPDLRILEFDALPTFTNAVAMGLRFVIVYEI